MLRVYIRSSSEGCFALGLWWWLHIGRLGHVLFIYLAGERGGSRNYVQSVDMYGTILASLFQCLS